MWTDERVEALKRLWAEGKTARQIAVELSIKTRSAVLGKAFRVGLVRGHKGNGIKRRPTVKPPAPVAKDLKPKASPLRELLASLETAPLPIRHDDPPLITCIDDLEPHHCRWIPGEPSDGWCGRQKVDGTSYCEFHARRAFAPPKAAVRAPYDPKPNTAPASLKRLLQTA